MSTITIGIVAGIVGCVNAIRAAGMFLKDGFEEQAAYLQGDAKLRDEVQEIREQLETCLVRPQSVPALQAHFQTLLDATTVPEFRQASAQVAAAVHAEHKALALEIAPLVAQATQVTNFQTVRQLQSSDRVLIVGENQQGKALQTEILTVPGQCLSIRTETIGFNDRTCNDTLNRFQDNLERQGVTINTTKRTGTLRQRLRSRLGVRQ